MFGICFKLLVKSSVKGFVHYFTIMKINQNRVMSEHLLEDARFIGSRIARLRVARRMTQVEAALRAGLSRNTAYRLEKGDPGLALGQLLRYLDAIAPGKTLLSLLQEDDPALQTLSLHEQTQRVREMSKSEMGKLFF